MFNCFEALSIMVLICLVHLQSQLKITPTTLIQTVNTHKHLGVIFS